jgi:hypothetical protein
MKKTLKTLFVIAVITLICSTIGEAAKDGRFIANYGNGTVLDTKTNLMWAAKDNGTDVSWNGAKSYCENFFAGGYKDWRMPTNDELASLYDAGKSRPSPCYESFNIHAATDLIQTTCFATWSSETRGSDASQFNFVYGTQFWYLQSHTYGIRALPVRSTK